MSKISQNEIAARRCIELFNQRTLAYIETCYAPNVEWVELPLPATPSGQHGDRAYLFEVAKRMLSLFPDRQMEIQNLITQGDQVVLELNWQGTAAMAVGNLRAGKQLRFQIASFLTFLEGLIIKQVDYCVFMSAHAS